MQTQNSAEVHVKIGKRLLVRTYRHCWKVLKLKLFSAMFVFLVILPVIVSAVDWRHQLVSDFKLCFVHFYLTELPFHTPLPSPIHHFYSVEITCVVEYSWQRGREFVSCLLCGVDDVQPRVNLSESVVWVSNALLVVSLALWLCHDFHGVVNFSYFGLLMCQLKTAKSGFFGIDDQRQWCVNFGNRLVSPVQWRHCFYQ